MSETTRAPVIDDLDVSAYTVPTEQPEADGTLQWESTTLVLVEAHARDGTTGLGYSYTHASAALLIEDLLADTVRDIEATAVYQAQREMVRVVRNLGRPGICACAISAVDIALWDLKAQIFDRPLVDVLNRVREAIPVYGSGGFCNYSRDRLREQLRRWVEDGVSMVKMKVGCDPEEDPERVEAAREAIDEAALFVDANGAYDPTTALGIADTFAEVGVTWFEEPVSSDDRESLRWLRNKGPANMDITAGEYGYDLFHFRDLLEEEAVDVLQIDVTRCGGITSFLAAGELARAHATDVSAHTAPNASAHVMCALPHGRHVEYFHDHVRIERMLFEGALQHREGVLVPDRSRSGMGLTFKHEDAAAYRVYP